MIDLVGSFSPAAREGDDTVVKRSRLFVDTFAGCLEEAGDLLDPAGRGVISLDQIEGELAGLVTGGAAGRGSDNEIILFKSVGTAIADLCATRIVLEQLRLGAKLSA